MAKISPKPSVPPECLRTARNPDPPRLWYGVPITLETIRAYVAKRGNPDGLDLRTTPLVMIPCATRLLREACGSAKIAHVRATCGVSEEQNRLIAFKCSRWPVARHVVREEDERMAAALREELGVPADLPCLWHFDFATTEQAYAVRPPLRRVVLF